MRVIVVGGGKVGFFLTMTLIENGHDVHIIESDQMRCATLADRLDIPVVMGDGTSIEKLMEADTENADAFIAVTGRDEDNLIACQLAKMRFNVDKTLARVNNPKNIEVMKALDVGYPVSSTKLISELIEQEVNSAGMKLLASISGKGAISQITIPKGAEIDGLPLSKIHLPSECLIVSVIRKERLIIPRGDTLVLAGDEILAVSTNAKRKNLVKILTKMR